MDDLPSVGNVSSHGLRSCKLDEIRTLLLTDRLPESGAPLHLFDGDGLSERKLAEIVHTSRVPVREALAVLNTLGVIEFSEGDKRYQPVLLIHPKSTEPSTNAVDEELIESVQCEILGNGRSAITRFVEASPTRRQRHDAIEPLLKVLDKAEERAVQNEPNLHARGEAVLLVNSAIAKVANAAGLRWAGDAIQSSLDLIEISTRYAQKDCSVHDQLPAASVRSRVNSCREIFQSLTSSNEGQAIIEDGRNLFEQYVEQRLYDLRKSCASVWGAASLAAA